MIFCIFYQVNLIGGGLLNWTGAWCRNWLLLDKTWKKIIFYWTNLKIPKVPSSARHTHTRDTWPPCVIPNCSESWVFPVMAVHISTGLPGCLSDKIICKTWPFFLFAGWVKMFTIFLVDHFVLLQKRPSLKWKKWTTVNSSTLFISCGNH